MRARTGRCTNYSGCKLAYRNERITVVTKEFVCPECGSHLEPVTSAPRSAGVWVLASGVLLVVALAVIAILWARMMLGQPEMPPSPRPVAVAAPAPTPTPEPTPTPTPVPTPLPTPPPTPVPTPTPTPTPDPYGFDMTAEEFDAMKAEVLTRIHQMPRLNEQQRSALITALGRARGLKLLARVSFAVARDSVTPEDQATIKAGLANPVVSEAIQNPALVFVVLGYASKSGSEEVNMRLSLGRADTVVAALQNDFGIQNVIYPVPMGPSSLLGGSFADNQAAEIWLVVP